MFVFKIEVLAFVQILLVFVLNNFIPSINLVKIIIS